MCVCVRACVCVCERERDKEGKGMSLFLCVAFPDFPPQFPVDPFCILSQTNMVGKGHKKRQGSKIFLLLFLIRLSLNDKG